MRRMKTHQHHDFLIFRSSKVHRIIALILVLLVLPFGVTKSADLVVTENGVFHDSHRNRDVPYRLYRPEHVIDQYPIVIFSHGLGGSREAAAYLGKHLAMNSYVAVHLQHPGSDRSVWQEIGKDRQGIVQALIRSLRDPKNALNRFLDIPFVLDELKRLNRSTGSLQGHLDLNRVGMAGHSYGGRSTMIAAGERVGKRYTSFKEPRIKAGLVLSPNLPRREVDLKRAYEDIDIPLFHITGTEDRSPLPTESNMDPTRRTKPYMHLVSSSQYLLVLQGATHMTFSGRRLSTGRETPSKARYIAVVKAGALAFFDAYLKDDTKALEWLRNTYPKRLKKGDRFEWKEGAIEKPVESYKVD